MNNEEFYQDKTNEDESLPHEELMPQKSTRRGLSVAALIFSVASLLCCTVLWVGVALGALAVACAVASRIRIGYFDRLSIGALIMGVFGIVFGLSVIIALSNPALAEIIQKMLSEAQKK